MEQQKKRSIYIWTKGIFDLPLSDRTSRYLFWEIDSWDRIMFNKIIKIFTDNGLSVYWHLTMNGFHFYNFKVMTKEEHAKIVKKLKFSNPEYTPNTLRIKPNKWEGELELWKNGGIEPSNLSGFSGESQIYELSRFRDWIENQHIELIASNYMVKSYPFEECPKCKAFGKLYCSLQDNKFYCKICHSEAVPRGGR